MNFNLPNFKELFLSVEISQLLHQHNCTYTETQEILQLLDDWIKQQRENMEYDTIDDLIFENKSRNIDDLIISPMNHVEPYC